MELLPCVFQVFLVTLVKAFSEVRKVKNILVFSFFNDEFIQSCEHFMDRRHVALLQISDDRVIEMNAVIQKVLDDDFPVSSVVIRIKNS